MSKTSGFVDPFARDLANFRLTANEIEGSSRRSGEASAYTPISTAPDVIPNTSLFSAPNITFNGETIGRRGRRQNADVGGVSSVNSIGHLSANGSNVMSMDFPVNNSLISNSSPPLTSGFSVPMVAGSRRRSGADSTSPSNGAASTSSFSPPSNAGQTQQFVSQKFDGKSTASQGMLGSAVSPQADPTADWLNDREVIETSRVAKSRSRGGAANSRGSTFVPAKSSGVSFLDGESDGNGENTSFDSAQDQLLREEQEKVKKLEAERLELYADLEAVELEMDAIQKKCDLLEIKEETALVELDTEILTKQAAATSLEEKLQEELKKVAETEQETMKKNSEKHTQELEELETELRQPQRSAYVGRINELQRKCDQISVSTRALREQVALLQLNAPYDKRSIISVVAGEKKSVGEPVSLADDAKRVRAGASSRTEGDESVEDDETPNFSVKFDRALSVIKDYCDERCKELRQHVVDYIHNETLDAAQEVSKARTACWSYEEMDRNSMLASFVQDFLERHRSLINERSELKERNKNHIHQLMKSQCEKLRHDADERIQSMIMSLKAKEELDRQSFEKKLQEDKLAQEESQIKIREADASFAASQLCNLDTRCATERSVRNQLFVAEKEFSLDQVRKKQRGEIDDTIRDLQRKEKERIEETMTRMQRSVVEWKTAVKKLLQQSAVPSSGDSHSHIFAISSTHPHQDEAVSLLMRGKELEDVLSTLIHTVSVEEDNYELDVKRCGEVLSKTMASISSIVQLIEKKKILHQTQAAKAEFQRRIWEREQRKALSTPNMLHLPSALAGSGASSVSSYGSPKEDFEAALLSHLVSIIRNRDAARSQVDKARKNLMTVPAELVEYIRRCAAEKDGTWASLLEAMLDTQQAIEEKVKQENELHSQRVELERQQFEWKMEKEGLDELQKSLMKVEEEMSSKLF